MSLAQHPFHMRGINMKNVYRITLRIIVTIILVWGIGFFLLLSPNANSSVGDIKVGWPSPLPAQGRKTTIPIIIDIDSHVLGSYAFTLKYDPNILSIDSNDVDGDAIPDAITTGCPQFGLPAAVNVDNLTGIIRINDFQVHRTAPSGLTTVVNITFDVVGKMFETGNITFSNTTVSNNNGDLVSSNPKEHTFNIIGNIKDSSNLTYSPATPPEEENNSASPRDISEKESFSTNPSDSPNPPPADSDNQTSIQDNPIESKDENNNNEGGGGECFISLIDNIY